jgi:hypothetical protein
LVQVAQVALLLMTVAQVQIRLSEIFEQLAAVKAAHEQPQAVQAGAVVAAEIMAAAQAQGNRVMTGRQRQQAKTLQAVAAEC